jgi:hypothetical protein
VTPSGDAYLVLHAGPGPAGAEVAWQVLCLAGDDPGMLSRPGGEDRLARIAGDLLEAYRPAAELAQARRLSVTAMAGKPGDESAVQQVSFTRGARGWRADGVAAGTVAHVPSMSHAVVRDLEEEASARDAAGAFMSDAERGDYDAAWAKASALLKAVMSRSEFDRRLAGAPRPHHAADELYLSFPATAGPFLPGALVEAWLARESSDGLAVSALVLRLDDDMEWRVAGAMQVTAAARAPSVGVDDERATSLGTGDGN